jgi:choline dehydrogenase-like flavoprotein
VDGQRPGHTHRSLARAGEDWWGQQLVDELAAYPHYLVPGTEGEFLPYAKNRVELSGGADEYGVPRPLATFSYGENEQAMRAEMHRLGTTILHAASAQRIVISEGNDHTMDGSRMGADRWSSVVDPDLRAWDHPDQYICHTSVFVRPGGAQPSQTITALATRLAEHLHSNTHPKEAS